MVSMFSFLCRVWNRDLSKPCLILNSVFCVFQIRAMLMAVHWWTIDHSQQHFRADHRKQHTGCKLWHCFTEEERTHSGQTEARLFSEPSCDHLPSRQTLSASACCLAELCCRPTPRKIPVRGAVTRLCLNPVAGSVLLWLRGDHLGCQCGWSSDAARHQGKWSKSAAKSGAWLYRQY